MKKYNLNYDYPAEHSDKGWQNQVLPIGSGRLGMCIFGGTDKEFLQFNEKTLWTGGPSDSRPNYEGGNIKESYKYLDKIRQALDNDLKRDILKYKDKLIGIEEGYGSYQNFGEIELDFNHKNISEYKRELDISTSLCTVSYKSNGVKFTREYIAVFEPSVLCAKFTSDKSKELNFSISFNIAHKCNVSAVDNEITVSGKLEDNGLKFYAKLKAFTDGKLESDGKTLKITDATTCQFALSAGTDYKNEYPHYRGNSPEPFVDKCLADFESKGCDSVKLNAITYYKSLFDRLEFNLTENTPNITTDKLLSDYQKNPNNINARYCEELLFQYGRYLIIASSYENEILPANLQGVWNNSNTPQWGCDYHLNVNLQMCYWHVFVANLAETAKPMLRYMNSLREPGRVTAEYYHNIKSDEKNPQNGWVCHTQNTPFGWTCPGWSFYWGWSPAASSWMMQNCFDYYAFTKDETMLREIIYPMMKENSQFWLNNLVYNKEQDRYVSSPSFSPEHGPISIGNTYEQSLIEQLFIYTEKSARLLSDNEFADKLNKVLPKLKPLHIGKWGQLKEWYEEDSWYNYKFMRRLAYKKHASQNMHRHASHLLGLYPGFAVTSAAPDLMEACKTSLYDRGLLNGSGGNSSGWGKANKANLWARAKDGNMAYTMLKNLIQNNIYENLWDFHPPYQMDGNCGYTSGICEMLLYSSDEYIELLPALPDDWQNGSIKGICARNGYEVDIEWQNGKLTSYAIHSKIGEKTAKVKIDGEIKEVQVV